MKNIDWDDFKKIEMRIGTIIEVNDFPEAIKPAYQLKINQGKENWGKTIKCSNYRFIFQR